MPLCCQTAPVLQRAVTAGSKLWDPGETITWSSETHTDLPQVRAAFDEWDTLGSYTFQEIPSGGEIRVTFDYTAGSWSYVGTDARLIPAPTATMNFGWPLPAGEPTALHEIGHALGLLHEHQSTQRTIVFNVPNLYAELALQGWTQADVDANIIAFAAGDETAYDIDSIMHYPIGAASIDSPEPYATTGTPYNTALSAADRAWAATSYPAVNQPLTLITSNGTGVHVVGLGGGPNQILHWQNP